MLCYLPGSVFYENDVNVILDHAVILTEPAGMQREEARVYLTNIRHGGVNRSSSATALGIRKT